MVDGQKAFREVESLGVHSGEHRRRLELERTLRTADWSASRYELYFTHLMRTEVPLPRMPTVMKYSSTSLWVTEPAVPWSSPFLETKICFEISLKPIPIVSFAPKLQARVSLLRHCPI